MPGQPGRMGAARSEAVQIPVSDEPDCPRHTTESTGSALLHAALTRENLQKAFKRVRANKGVAGVDGLDIDQTARALVHTWPVIRQQILQGMYRPSPVRRVLIPKVGQPGKHRPLGIPTVKDRVVQAAMKNILEPIFEADFFPCSYGENISARAPGVGAAGGRLA